MLKHFTVIDIEETSLRLNTRRFAKCFLWYSYLVKYYIAFNNEVAEVPLLRKGD